MTSEEQSDQGLHYLPICRHLLHAKLSVKPPCSNFRVITASFSGVQNFRIFTVAAAQRQGQKSSFEPSHATMVNSFFKHTFCCHPVGLDVWVLVRPFVYFHSCVRTAKALARLRGCAGSPEPSLVAYVISTIISWAGSFLLTPSWNLRKLIQDAAITHQCTFSDRLYKKQAPSWWLSSARSQENMI